MTSPSVVEFAHVTKRFGPVLALEDVHGTLRATRITGLMGRNGAGKTTLMRVIAGMAAADTGEISIAGHPPGSDAGRRAVSLLPEVPALYVTLTVWEHIRFMGTAFGTDGWRIRGGELLEAFALTAHRDRLPPELSLGMRRKLSIAMALLRGSDALLLDEPFNGLDPPAVHELRARLIELAAAGTAVLVSMHGLRELALAHDYIVLESGRVVAAGTGAQLRAAAAVGDRSTLEQAFVQLATVDG